MLLKKLFAFSTNEKLFNRTFLTLFAVHVLENSHKTNADRERKRGRETVAWGYWVGTNL